MVNRRHKLISVLIGLIMIVLSISSCTSVKPYQKMYLNDEEMKLSERTLNFYELNFQSYREGASGANGGKSGGGCGCN